MLKKIFKSIFIMLCFIMLGIVNANNCSAEATDIITSGNYQYSILSETDKTITLLKILNYGETVEVPGQIDGYTVTVLGSQNEFGKPVFLNEITEKDSVIKKLIIPDSVYYIGYNACCGLSAMTELILPDNVTIKDYGFSGASSLTELTIKEGYSLGYNVFTDINLERLTIIGDFPRNEDGSISGKIKKMIVYPSENNTVFDFYGIGTAEDVYINSGISKLIITDSIAENNLYIYGEKTAVQLEKGNPLYQGKTVICNRIITCEGAKAVNFAKKNKVNYTTISTPKRIKVKSSKIKNGYTYSWKKTYIKKADYSVNAKGKWKVKNSKRKASYNVYVKKSGKYKLVEATKKTKYNTRKKSEIKVVVVNEQV